MAQPQAVVRLTSCWTTCSLLTASLFLSSADAAGPERVAIQMLLSPQATFYQQRLVMLEGVVNALQTEPPFPSRCLLYGRATFMLEDETSSLPVEILGSCKPSAVEALPKDGDRVQIIGLVQVLKSEAPRDVRVQAT